MSDRFGAHRTTWIVMWVALACFFVLSYPATDLAVHSADGPRHFHITTGPALYTALMFVVGVAMAVGKASVFKFIAEDFPTNIGAVSGVVGLAGGLAGFFLPVLFGLLTDLTGVRTTCFMLMFGATVVSLISMHFTFQPGRAELRPEAPSAIVFHRASTFESSHVTLSAHSVGARKSGLLARNGRKHRAPQFVDLHSRAHAGVRRVVAVERGRRQSDKGGFRFSKDQLFC